MRFVFICDVSGRRSGVVRCERRCRPIRIFVRLCSIPPVSATVLATCKINRCVCKGTIAHEFYEQSRVRLVGWIDPIQSVRIATLLDHVLTLGGSFDAVGLYDFFPFGYGGSSIGLICCCTERDSCAVLEAPRSLGMNLSSYLLAMGTTRR